jgi:ASC-1-like (ASCH) protein
MEHHMRLSTEPFELIASGKKTVEVRLNDEKRQAVHVGDRIVFSKLPALHERMTVSVVEINHYKNFQELVDLLPMTDFGYPLDANPELLLGELRKIYDTDEESRYGVVAFRIRVL